MPVYPGAPWVPKYKGPEADVSYGDWKEQIQGLLNAQEIAEARKVEILIGALSGEAKRQVSVLEEKDRDQIRKIFAYLDSLYGDNTSLAVLRSQFFSCIQKQNESVKSFTLRLRELHCRLQQRNPNQAPTEKCLQEQMLLGLREGPLSQTLRAYVRHHPEEDFATVHREALLLEEEQLGHQGLQTTCLAVGESRCVKPPYEPDWKETFKKEIMEDVKGQMRDLVKDVVNEIKPLLPQQSPAGSAFNKSRFKPKRSGYANNWTREGEPICHRCKQAGHIARFCPSTLDQQPPLN